MNDYRHWGQCQECKKDKDLNDLLLCLDCTEKIRTQIREKIARKEQEYLDKARSIKFHEVKDTHLN